MEKRGSSRPLVTRVIIDSQSNPHFFGLESEQDYDQRAALSQGREGDIAITTNPIDQAYISYWKGLGFSIPTLLTAGPFEKTKVLSHLIFEKQNVQEEIKKRLNGSASRVEFFTPSYAEETLAKHLDLPAYLNFDFAKEMQKKEVFKKLCEEIGISTLPYVHLNKDMTWEYVVRTLGKSTGGYIAKHIYGTGGAGLGTILPLKSEHDFLALNGSEDYIIEKMITLAMEVSIHWEIDFTGKVTFINCFEQIAENISYAGAIFPAKIPQRLMSSMYEEYRILTERIAQMNGLGYMCCDILVDNDGNFYWSDLNPRKGAILFVYDAVTGFLQNHDQTDRPYFVKHKQIKTTGVRTFSDLADKLRDRLKPAEDGVIMITNPGVIRHGVVDLTAISFLNHSHASRMIDEAQSLVKG